MSINNLHPERPSSSLSESWTTLSTSDIQSEDDARSEQTDTVSLIGQSGADDVTSLDGRTSSTYGDDEDDDNDDDNGHYNDEYGDKESVISDSQELPRPFFAHDDSTVDDSNITTKACLMQSSEAIEFLEPENWPEMERIELKHTIHILDDTEVSSLRTQLPMKVDHSHLAITIQQTMTKQGLELDKPFRVLYVGNPEFRNIILDKIGDVLVSSSTSNLGTSSTESSRYHVVPTSFGIGATPNYAELLPIHVQLIVDECLDAASVKTGQITLKFKNRPSCTSSWNGSERHIQSEAEWNVPDLAIIFISDGDSETAVHTRTLAHDFMKAHGVPVMVISEEPFWKKPSQHFFNLDYHSLHLCLESRRPLTGETIVLRRYPIDVKTFESITPSQLNRHLASLSGGDSKITSTTKPPLFSSLKSKVFYDSEKYPTIHFFSPYTERAQEFAPFLRLVMLSIVLAVSVSLGYTVFRVLALLCVQLFTSSAVSNTTGIAPGATITAEIISSTELAGATSVALRTHSTDLSRIESLSISTVSELAEISSLLADPQSNGDEFQFQVVGDCHVIIKPPTAVKQNKFNVNVTRGEQSLSYELSKLFDGVYTLRLNREDAYGLVNLTVSVKSRRAKTQTFEADFGTPWLKIENWKRAAQAVSSQIMKDWGSAQTGLSDIYTRLSTDVQVWVGDVVKKSHSLRREVESLHYNPTQFKTTRDAIIARSRELSEVVTRNALQRITDASVALEKVHEQSKALNKGLYKAVNDAVDSITAHSKDLDKFTKRFRDIDFRELKTLDSLVRAQKSAKKLTERNFRRPHSRRGHAKKKV
ncbi:hypothetical protein BGW36DRAFT_297122 [Talaromyces proteolyticus]|uniref:Uncharacterized protein n=1 Tax=Talaromyces proteolyticus TaxID=1131652 RepID=A0AAD4KML4_9EURO|nr:uncharacterized protein BGW36DRAFT_297122 [Talaromyces proteolyticus]KAH8696222.1 hypothetical protein BGW36DRAFT_297122 [Talaromyces proteolyticus]